MATVAAEAPRLHPPAALFGKRAESPPEETWATNWAWDSASTEADKDNLGNNPRLLCEDRARHALFSLRLRKDYLLYCFICFLLAIVVCTSTVTSLWHMQKEGQAISAYQRRSWEAGLEAVIGTAVITETLSTLWLSGRRTFVRDGWCVFDATVVMLTLLDWCLQLLRWALFADRLLRIDLPLLTLRFSLQPCRMLTAVSMVRRVRKMQQGVVDVVFDVLQNEDQEPEKPAHLLTRSLQNEIEPHLPSWCRFREWRLSYTPGVHGTSMRTFFRSQQTCGANVLVLQTADGVTLGGFVADGLQACQTGSYYYGNGDYFIFTTAKVSQGEGAKYLEVEEDPNSQRPTFFHAKGGSEVLVWGDGTNFSIGGAFSIHDDFRMGSSVACDAFGSPALLKGGDSDFAIAAFECWELV